MENGVFIAERIKKNCLENWKTQVQVGRIKWITIFIICSMISVWIYSDNVVLDVDGDNDNDDDDANDEKNKW